MTGMNGQDTSTGHGSVREMHTEYTVTGTDDVAGASGSATLPTPSTASHAMSVTVTSTNTETEKANVDDQTPPESDRDAPSVQRQSHKWRKQQLGIVNTVMSNAQADGATMLDLSCKGLKTIPPELLQLTQLEVGTVRLRLGYSMCLPCPRLTLAYIATARPIQYSTVSVYAVTIPCMLYMVGCFYFQPASLNQENLPNARWCSCVANMSWLINTLSTANEMQ